MKKSCKILLILSALFLGIGSNVTLAQTNGDQVSNLLPAVNPAEKSLAQEFWSDYLLSTNSAFVIAAGANVADTKKRIYAIDYIYGFNANAGLILGVDQITGGPAGDSKQLSALRGGLQLKTTIQPLQTFGISLQATPYAAELVSTTLEGTHSGQVGLVTIAGVDFDVWDFAAGSLHLGGMYENRTGEGWADGHYALIEAAFRLNHIKVAGKPW